MLSTELNNVLASHVQSKNNHYHAIVHDIFSKNQPDIENLRNELINKVGYNTESNMTIYTSFDIDITKLLTDNVEFYFIGSVPLPLCELYKHSKTEVHVPKEYHIKFKNNNDDIIWEAFKVYLYTTDPDVCEFRDKLRSAFPDASISVQLFNVASVKSYLNIQISYKLESIQNVVELEKSKNPTWFRGDSIKW